MLLGELELRPSKRLGQNFLFDDNLAKAMARFALPKPAERVLEIGGGLGSLTCELVPLSVELEVVEFDKRLVQYLRREFTESSVRVVQADIRERQFSSAQPKWTVVGNVPYSISSDILFWLLNERAAIQTATLLVQSQFAERLLAKPHTKDYGILSVITQLLADIERGPKFPGHVFVPTAEVESLAVKLRFLSEPRFEVKDLEWFRLVVRGAFSKRRKTLVNALSSYPEHPLPAEVVRSALQALGLEETRRAESLSVEEFCLLALKLE